MRKHSLVEAQGPRRTIIAVGLRRLPTGFEGDGEGGRRCRVHGECERAVHLHQIKRAAAEFMRDTLQPLFPITAIQMKMVDGCTPRQNVAGCAKTTDPSFLCNGLTLRPETTAELLLHAPHMKPGHMFVGHHRGIISRIVCVGNNASGGPCPLTAAFSETKKLRRRCCTIWAKCRERSLNGSRCLQLILRHGPGAHTDTTRLKQCRSHVDTVAADDAAQPPKRLP